MTSSDYTTYIRNRINESFTQNVSYYEPNFSLSLSRGTAHASIYAADGGVVAITSTIDE